MNVFAEGSLHDFLDSVLAAIKRDVHAEQRDHLLNLNEQDFVTYLVVRYTVDPIAMRID